jgi:hypothetical protein
MSLHGRYCNVRPLEYLNEDEFTGTVEWRHPNVPDAKRFACYGWSKGGKFFIYKIEDGHIEKLGVLGRDEIESN